jgi:hypothetical protein
MCDGIEFCDGNRVTRHAGNRTLMLLCHFPNQCIRK